MSYKVPVLLSKVAETIYVARVVDGPDGEAIGATPAEAMSHLQKHLRDIARQDAYAYWPEVQDVELKYCELRVRLFYRDGNKRFPASELLKLPVRYVVGIYSDGSVECYLPDWEREFFCPDRDELESLLSETIRGCVARLSPEEVRRRVPPAEAELRTIRVRGEAVARPQTKYRLEALRTIARPLGARARGVRVEHALAREAEIETLSKLLADTRQNILIVGPAGAGKTTLLQSAVRQWMQQKQTHAGGRGNDEVAAGDRRFSEAGEPVIPAGLSRVWGTSAGAIIAGMQYLGEWEERLQEAIEELSQFAGVLCIDSFIELVRLGGRGAADSLAAFMRSFVMRGELRIVAETTAESLDAVRRLLPGWAECFQIVKLQPLDARGTKRVVERIFQAAERNHQVTIEDGTSEVLVRLFSRYLPYQTPPRGPALLARRLIQHARGGEAAERSVDRQAAVQLFTEHSGLPGNIVNDRCPIRLAELNTWFGERVLGQPEAIDAATRVVTRLKSGMNDPARPISVMLFTGPTGVGKTQLAKSLGDYLFAAREERTRLVRLDMSEYAGYGGADRLLMDARSEPAGWLQTLRQWPMSVLLFDEIEKASTEVFDCLLGALDEGRITDRFGRTTTLCGTVVIMTSNVGATMSSSLGFDSSSAAELTAVQHRYSQALRETFRPEFLNRLDYVITFRPLTESLMRSLVSKELHDLARREAIVTHGVKLTWTDKLVDYYSRAGFDRQLGARPLQRKLEQELVANLAMYLLANPQTREIELDTFCDGLKNFS